MTQTSTVAVESFVFLVGAIVATTNICNYQTVLKVVVDAGFSNRKLFL